MMATYKGKSLGTWGEIGAYSFHETKNYTCGEGGALLINHEDFIERAEIIREKGTNRTSFFRGEVDKYSWIDIGSSYLPGELVAAFLYAQLEIAQEIKKDRLNSWNGYYEKLKYLKEKGCIELPVIPEGCDHNAHMFYIKVKDLNERTKIIANLRAHNIYAVFHYIPLHSSKAGLKHGSFSGDDIFTTKESERLLRLPLYYKITTDEIDYIVQKINSFFMNSL
jgi:dTDP-4-amino-4,6-dideoxygalactose transaminase